MHMHEILLLNGQDRGELGTDHTLARASSLLVRQWHQASHVHALVLSALAHVVQMPVSPPHTVAHPTITGTSNRSALTHAVQTMVLSWGPYCHCYYMVPAT